MAIMGLGTDIIDIRRIDTQLQRSERLAERVLTEQEYALFKAHHFPARYLAKRFAGKEAMVKALGTGIGEGIGFQQMEILNDERGKPLLSVSGYLAERCEQLGIRQFWISLSDEQDYATATVVLES